VLRVQSTAAVRLCGIQNQYMKKIILASSSPRRKALLEQIHLEFTVDTHVQEDAIILSREPHKLAREISLKKAESAAGRYPDALIIAADTIGVIDGHVIGKPHSESEARLMLGSLSGKSHAVITGFTVLDTLTGKSVSRSVETTVNMKQMTDSEIDAYVQTGEPLDKAGAYAIQGLGAVLVEKIEGDYSNVMGLPLAAMSEVLKEFGFNVL
jgi:septum formation protein